MANQYRTIADAAFVTGNPAYDGKAVRIWYMKPDSFRDFIMGPRFLERQGIPLPTLETVANTHVLLGTLGTRDPNAIFQMMQGEFWSPMGEANSLIRGKGLRHTSMSVGDIIQIGNKLIMVDGAGFKKLALRKRLIRLAAAVPELRPHLLPLLKQARGYPEAIESLMADLRRLQGVDSVYVTDTWKDGYHHLRVVLKPQPGKTPWGGMSNTGIFDIKTNARGGYDTVYNFPLYPKIIQAIRALVKRSGLSLEGISGLQKVYEYQDAYDRASREPKKGGYSDNEISVEVYV